MKDYHRILGVSYNATPDEIKKAFRRLAHIHHPDKGGDANKFKEISEAYSALKDRPAQSDSFRPDSTGPGFYRWTDASGTRWSYQTQWQSWDQNKWQPSSAQNEHMRKMQEDMRRSQENIDRMYQEAMDLMREMNRKGWWMNGDFGSA